VGFFNLEYNRKWNIFLSLMITFSSIGIAYFYPNCQEIFAISGSFFGTTIISTIPGLMMCTYLWKHSQQTTLKSFLFHVWLFIFSILGYFCGVTLLMNLRNNN